MTADTRSSAAVSSGEEAVYDSAHPRIPMREELAQLLRYHDLVRELVSRNIKVRYKRSVLGVLWTMLNPLMTMTILTLVFATLFRLTLRAYAVYLLTGLLLWGFFSQTTLTLIGEVVWSASVWRRVYVPKTVFAVASVCTSLVNLVLSLVPLTIVMLTLGVPVRPAVLILPVPILLTAMFTLGTALIVAMLAASFADVAEIYQVLLTAWMYVTPVIYPTEIIPESYRWLFRLNPMFPLVEMFRAPIYRGVVPPLDTVAWGVGVAVGTLTLGWWWFTRHADQLVYRT